MDFRVRCRTKVRERREGGQEPLLGVTERNFLLVLYQIYDIREGVFLLRFVDKTEKMTDTLLRDIKYQED